MSDIILLGGNILNGGVVKNKEKYGANRVIVFDWNENPPVKGDCFIQCDIKDTESIIDHLKKNNVIDLKFVYTSADIAVPTQKRIHELYGFATIDDSIIQKTLRKSDMTDIWKTQRLLNRESCIIKNPNQLTPHYNCGDWIVKPNLCSGSRGITIMCNCSSPEEWKIAYNRAADASWDNKVIIEEFVIGTEFTVEMIGDSEGNVEVWGVSKKYHTHFNHTNKIATKLHYNPVDVSSEQLYQIAEYGIKCYKALGLKNSLGHLELIMTKDGKLSPLEIGARSSGYIASHCLDFICDDSYLNAFFKMLRGGKVNHGYRLKNTKSSMLYFYDMPIGRSIRDGNIMDFMPTGINSLAYDRSNIKKDINYSKIDGDGERYGFEILAGEKNKLTIDMVDNAEKKMIEWMYH